MPTKKELIGKKVAEYNELKDDVEALEAELKTLREQILAGLPVGETDFAVDGEKFRVLISSRKGSMTEPLKRKVARDMPFDEFPEIYKHVPDAEALRDVLGDDADEYFSESTLSLKIEKK